MNTPPTPSSPVPPTPQPRLTICPYCGARSRSLAACESCGGRFDPLSRQATQNAMGPWFVRIESQPFRPGCNYATLLHLIERGTVRADTAVRGPTTKQFWMLARWCPGVAHRLGVCHSCQAKTDPESRACDSCGAEFVGMEDRQTLGLGEVRPLPGRSARSQSARQDLHIRIPAAGMEGGESDGLAEAARDGPVPGADELPDDLGDEALRELRLRRDLRRSRRWTAAWSALALLTLTGLGGYLVFQQLDLGSGPVGRWIAAHEPGSEAAPSTVPSVTGANGSALVDQPLGGEVNTPDAPSGAGSTSLGDAGSDGTILSTESPPTGEEPGPEEEPGPRIRTLSRLRGLR